MRPHPTSWRSILILSSNLCLDLPNGLFPSGLPTKTLYAHIFYPHTCYMTRPSHSPFDHPNNIWWGQQVTKFPIMQFSPLPCYFVLLRTNFFLSILFSNTLSLRSSHNVSNQVSRPYKTGKIIVLYHSIFIFLHSKLEDKMQTFPDFNLLLISSWTKFYIPYAKSHIPFPLLRSYQRTSPGPRQGYPFRNKASFNGEELLASRPTPKLEEHPLSAVRYY